MQQIAHTPTTAHRLPDPILRDILARRIAGQPLTRLASDLSLSLSTLHHVTSDLCAAKDDIAALDDRARIRQCMCCRRPLLSQHAGHRLCRSCAAGVEPQC